MNKYYTITPAYGDYSYVTKYVDGKAVSQIMVSNYVLPTYEKVFSADGFMLKDNKQDD